MVCRFYNMRWLCNYLISLWISHHRHRLKLMTTIYVRILCLVHKDSILARGMELLLLNFSHSLVESLPLFRIFSLTKTCLKKILTYTCAICIHVKISAQIKEYTRCWNCIHFSTILSLFFFFNNRVWRVWESCESTMFSSRWADYH